MRMCSAAGLNAAAVRGSLGARQQGSAAGQQRKPPAGGAVLPRSGRQAWKRNLSQCPCRPVVRTGLHNGLSCIEGVKHRRVCL